MSTITEKLTRLAQYKEDIKSAIINKGQTVNDNMSTFADAISKISGGGGDLPEILDTDPLTFVRVDNVGLDGGISIINNGVTNTKAFEYNKNDTGWTAYTVGDEITMNYGDKVQFRSNNTTAVSTGSSVYRYFKTRGLYNCGGTLASLMNNNTTITLYNYCFYCLFRNCNIIKAPVLPFTKLGNYCYGDMFIGCTSLVTTPELPATTLAQYCYYYMFSGCTSLVTASELPATTLANYCYEYMFNGCTSLTTAPELPATTLSNYCYGYMFQDCTNLVNAPELPATTLASSCYYYMFNGCTKLTTAPELPVTTLATSCYGYMFYNCTSLVNAPKLPATTLASDCYGNMFRNCTNLKEIYCNARYVSGTTEITTSIGSNWLSGTPNTSSCVFHKNPNWSGPTSRGNGTIPSSWQIVDWIDAA